MSKAPAIPSTAVAMPNAHCLIRIGLAPISRSASWSCPTARIARPMHVRDRYNGRQHQKGRMRDVGNVEQAERDGQSKADRRIEAAEQHTDHHRIEQQVK